VAAALFSGRESLRVRGERTTFVWTLLTLPVSILILGWLLQHAITWQEIALLLVLAMVYVSFARGRLLGAGLRVHAGQFAHIHAVVDECARMARLPMPHVFVRDDPFVPVVAVGIGEPYAIVISAQFVEHFRPEELRFLVGRELGHIAAGHTRFTSLLSANGRETGVIAVAFGAWLRRIEYTADRVGLLCCGSLETAMRAIAVATFGAVGRTADLAAFAGQLKELHAEPSLRMAEWTASTPYSTNRIAALHRFTRDPLFLAWAPRFAANVSAAPVPDAHEAVYAGFWRRTWAFLIDIAVIQAIVPAAAAVQERVVSLKQLAADPDVAPIVSTIAKNLGASGNVHVSFGGNALLWLVFGVYAHPIPLTPIGAVLGIWIILSSLIDPIDRWRRHLGRVRIRPA